MDKITTIGLDLAKQVFQLHGVDERGHVVARRASVASGCSKCSPKYHAAWSAWKRAPERITGPAH